MTRTAKLTAGAVAVFIVISILYGAATSAPDIPATASAGGTQPVARTAAGKASLGPGWFSDLGSHRFPNDEMARTKPTEQELKNPYTRATLYQECATYFETRGQLADDIDGANRLDPSGKTAEGIRWAAERYQARCEDVSRSDLARIDELMAQAAKAGEPGAQRHMLFKDLRALEQARRAGGADAATLQQQGATLLSQATDLAKRGDLPSAAIAARLTSSDRYGQGNKIASAAWMMLAVQDPAQSFSTRLLGQEQPSFESLSQDEYNEALQRAQAMYANCCSHPQQR